jgi:hypothetical protein
MPATVLDVWDCVSMVVNNDRTACVLHAQESARVRDTRHSHILQLEQLDLRHLTFMASITLTQHHQ